MHCKAKLYTSLDYNASKAKLTHYLVGKLLETLEQTWTYRNLPRSRFRRSSRRHAKPGCTGLG